MNFASQSTICSALIPVDHNFCLICLQYSLYHLLDHWKKKRLNLEMTFQIFCNTPCTVENKSDLMYFTCYKVHVPHSHHFIILDRWSPGHDGFWYFSGSWHILNGNEIGSLLGWWAFHCHKVKNPDAFPGKKQYTHEFSVRN